MSKKLFLNSIESKSINSILCEYYNLVKRFPQWFALTIALTEDEIIRKLLLPNLVEETGDLDKNPSHLQFLKNLLNSCEIDYNHYSPSEKTREIESWFYTLFASDDTYKKLCVLGPATERFSQSFLDPLEEAVRDNFKSKNVDYTYFDEHRPEVEVHHADDLDKAIKHFEDSYLSIPQSEINILREKYVSEGIAKHSEFWENLLK